MPDILRGKQWQEATDPVVIPDWMAPAAAPEDLPEDDAPEQQADGASDPAPAAPQQEAAPEIPQLSEDQLRALYQSQWNVLRQDLERRAYRDAVEAARARLENCLSEMNRHLNRLDEMHEQFVKEYADSLKYLAIDIAEKWILTRLESDDMILEKLVMQAVADVKNAKWMDVQLSEKMVKLARQIEQDLEAPEYVGRVQVSGVDAPVGTCVVHTDAGDIDASIQTQAQQLKKVFQTDG